MSELPQPFRWNVQKREQLGRLVANPDDDTLRAWAYGHAFLEDLRACCARILSQCSQGHLVFVGRSPDDIFDYLSGVFEGTRWADRILRLPISMRGYGMDEIRRRYPPDAEEAMRQIMTKVGLSPANVAQSKDPYVLIDIVSEGETFGSIDGFLRLWGTETGADLPRFRQRLRFIGLTIQRHTSPNTWRWHQHADWLNDYPAKAAKNVSLHYLFWKRLAGDFGAAKASDSNSPRKWGRADIASPNHSKERLHGLYVAWRFYELGRTRDEKRAFVKAMAKESGVKYSWYRSLANEITS